MRYTAKVMFEKTPTITMTPFRALDIRQAAEIVRAKYGFCSEQSHKGFVITEVRKDV